MSNNQPGPYGQPQGPYGQGGSAGQPGYGYPQQPPAGQPGPPPPPGQPGPPPPGQPGGYAQPGPPPPPGQPGGYGQPQPGYGYPQQPGAAPYGQPQQPGPYGQSGPYGQPQGPYGQPGMPPQGNRNRTVAIVVSAVVVVGLVIGGVVLFTNKGGDDKSDKSSGSSSGGLGSDGKKYELKPPATIGADWKRSQNDTSGDNADLPGMSDPHPVSAGYTGQNSQTQQMKLYGSWGTVTNPEQAVDAAFKSEAKGSASAHVTPQGEPKKVSPAGFDGTVMKCQLFTMSGSSGAAAGISIPICIWGDSSTVGEVTVVDTSMSGSSHNMSLDQLAKLTTKARKASLAPRS